jgi:hypothetical protein
MSTQFTVKDTVQSMIDCNCPMVFYYTHSKPKLQRIAHPVLIVGKHVVCVESNTGKHKRFKLDGIQFPPENTKENKLNEVENIINAHINKQFSFTYSNPWEDESVVNEIKTVIVEKIANGQMLGREGHIRTWFSLEHIRPVHVDASIQECEGCKYNCPGQRDHMGYGGCLSDDAPSKKEPKIVSKRHFWDCGYAWNYLKDRCDCGERGWAHCWFDDGHKEVLNNM